MIDPQSGRYFYRVETRRFAKRWIHWIDAGNGKVLARSTRSRTTTARA